MKTKRIPKTDSIRELARFWDTHEVTEFESELEEVTEQVFEPVIPLSLQYEEAKAVRRIAKTEGVPDAVLIRSWIQEKINSN